MAKEIPPIIDLLKNPNISEKILFHFDNLTSKSNEKPIDLKNPSIKLEYTQYPFNSKLYNSYIMSWESTILYKHRKNNITGYPMLIVEASLRRYARGFRFGYFNFEKDILKEKTQTFKSDENRIQVIFDYACMPYPKMTHQYLDLSCYKNTVKLYKNGIKRGYYYRAWTLVLENHKYFEDLFNKLETKDEIETKDELEKLTFVTTFNEEQLNELWIELKGIFIDKNTDCKLFKAVFDSESKHKLAGKIKWILLTSSIKPHKTALRELLTFILGSPPNQQIIDYCFSDANGNQIVVPKKHAPSNYYNDLEIIINKIKTI
jgi:hypothetical protein